MTEYGLNESVLIKRLQIKICFVCIVYERLLMNDDILSIPFLLYGNNYFTEKSSVLKGSHRP